MTSGQHPDPFWIRPTSRKVRCDATEWKEPPMSIHSPQCHAPSELRPLATCPNSSAVLMAGTGTANCELQERLADRPKAETNSRPERTHRNLLDSPFARKISAFAQLSPNDLNAIADLCRRRQNFPAGRDMIHAGQICRTAYILNQGWASSYKILANGTRQIVGIQIPGDFLGFGSLLLRASDHNVEPITAVSVSKVPVSFVLQTFASSPRLASAILWAASRDQAIVVENLVRIGRRTAVERVAHLLLELAIRLRLVGLDDKAGYACPLSQYFLADALGLSAVHVNRCLRDLREKNLVTFQNDRVVFHDFDKLVDFSGFDRTYLDHEGHLLQ